MATLSSAFVQQYLARIGRSPNQPLPPPTHATLARLQWAHLKAVPFENLSLKLEAAQLQHGIDTDLQAIYDKIVLGRRGGYCFEQNGLFGAVLRSLGFDVIDAAARVVQSGDSEPEEVEEAPLLPGHSSSSGVRSGALPGVNAVKPQLRLSGHDHHILLVSLPDGGGSSSSNGNSGMGSGEDGQQQGQLLWLVDCGFGGECLPLPLALPQGAQRYAVPSPDACATAPYAGQAWAEEEDGEEEGGPLPLARLARYRLRLGLPGVLATPDPRTTPHFPLRAGYYLQHLSVSSGQWKDLFFFRLDEFLPQDFSMQNHYIASCPASHFQKNLVVARHTPQGRLTLLNDSFRVWHDGVAAPREEVAVEGEQQLLEILERHFGIAF